MKKTLTIAIALIACLAMVAPAMATGGSNHAYTDGGTDIEFGNGKMYNGNSYRYADGYYNSENSYMADAYGKKPKARGFSHAEGDIVFSKKNIKNGSVTRSKATVESDAAAWTRRARDGGSTHAEIYGFVDQNTGNDIFKMKGDGYAGAWGFEHSEAEYHSVTGDQGTGFVNSGLRGDALARGKTKVTASVTNGGRTSEALGVTRANSNAQWNAFTPDCFARAQGDGYIGCRISYL